ncbi:chromosome segregation protein SMC (plasmid) [Natrinema zhouii]|uniref:archaea-specific SMC-related protein n=1 Tax=Natrinema zhouii TaxID=1710539 RepID=UPI001CFFDC80|nr:archaea-specific SMC-related protein [Natrinema zhouii]UHQ99234.1 chromosome segregation protein SMC [Natrinema zhouii]
MPQHTNATPATVSVRNIGGINRCEMEFGSGVTVLTGQNATNRTSLLSAIAGALGGSTASLKSDTEEGNVQLEFNGETYTRHYYRQSDGTVVAEGDPYTDDPIPVDLFACLLEDNPARRAVERGDDLRDVLMRPVDTDHIQERVQELEHERNQVSARLEEIERKRDRLPGLEEHRTALEADLEDTTEELETLREQVADQEVDVETASAAEELLNELESRRQALTRIRDQIETQQSTLKALREERAEISDEVKQIDERDADHEGLEQKLDRLQDHEHELQNSINDLSALVEFNEELIDSPNVLTSEEQSEQDTAAELDPMSTTVKCWTCGNHVERRAIDTQLTELRNVIKDKRTKRREIQTQITEAREKLKDIRSREERQHELKERLDEIDRQIQRREQQVDDLEEKASNIQTEIRKLEKEVTQTEDLRESKLVEQYEQLSELEYERGQIEQELTDVEDQIRELAALTDEREQLKAQRSQLQEELESLRTRIEDLERDAVDAFNEHMAEVLSLLEYKNIERIWIERKALDGGPEGSFELHVVRSTEDGAVYEDTINHLSESEREVTGLLVALAGYLVHDVYERVPVILLDSLEAIDAERISRLIDYLAEFAPYLIVALLEEDAQELNNVYTEISADAFGS